MLRDYQIEGLRAIHSAFSDGDRRVMLVLPTGAGKTTVFCEVLKAFAAAARPGLMVVRGRKLVDQAAERLRREGVRHSVIMAGDRRSDPEALITCASVDTLYRRRLAPPADILVIDECHLAFGDAFDWLFSQYPDAYYLPVTATPFSDRGFELLASRMIAPVRVRQLIDQGYLVPAKYFVPERPDLSTVKRRGDDYIVSDLADAMNQTRLFGPIVETWKKLGEGKPTLLFAVNVSHSQRLAEAFNAAGIAAQHLDASASEDQRKGAVDGLAMGSIQVLCSVGLFTTGFDLPAVSTLILARPTLSYNLHIQMLGRAARPFPGKTHFTVLDHAGNVERHGMYETHRPAALSGKPPVFFAPVTVCEGCFAVTERRTGPCPALMPDGTLCGHANAPEPTIQRPIETDDKTELVELSPEEIERRQRERWIDATIVRALQMGYKKGYAYHQISKRYGKDIANGSWRAIHEAYR